MNDKVEENQGKQTRSNFGLLCMLVVAVAGIVLNIAHIVGRLTGWIAP